MATFEQVKAMLLDMRVLIESENVTEEMLVISDEERGVSNMVIDCEGEILIIEQVIMPFPENISEKKAADMCVRLLQMNRNIVHGAFAIDEEARYVIFRDTLQLANLDSNELEASINSLHLMLTEYADELIAYSKES